MWWAGRSRRVNVYLGSRILAVYTPGEEARVSRVQSEGEAVEALAMWARERRRGLTLRLWLSGGLCRPFMLPPIARVKAEELERIATSLVAQELGWSSDAVVVRVDRGGNSAGAVALAARTQTVGALRNDLERAGVRIESIRPWWAEVLSVFLRADPNGGSIAVQDCDSVCVIAGEGRAIQHATVISPVEDTAAADAAIARLRFSLGITSRPTVARLRVADAGASENARSGFDSLVEWST